MSQNSLPTPQGSFLYVADGPSAGHTVPLKDRITIGRSSQCNLTLTGQLISRVHAEILFAEGAFVLRDLGSANGTYLNGELVNKAALQDNDQIKVGDTSLRVRVGLGPEQDLVDTGSRVVLLPDVVDETGKVYIHGQPSTLQTMMMGKDVTRAHRAHQRLQALVNITQNLARLRELEVLYPLVVDEVMRVVPAKRGTLLLLEQGGQPAPKVARNTELPGGQVEVSRSVVQEVVTKKICVMSNDAILDENIEASESIMAFDIRSVLCVPILYEDLVLGVIYLDGPGRNNLFSEEDLHFLSGVGGVAAVAITNSRAVEQARQSADELNRSYLSMLSVLANAIEARDHYTIGHTWRVARFAQAIARRMGWQEAKIKEVEVGGVLHDIGKIGVPDSILLKPEPLDAAERQRMMFHPQTGARMLHDVPTLQHVLPYVLYHHERFDGRGYPEGLKGEQIPAEARLLAVADALDAMTSDRPYRAGLPHYVALEEVRRHSGAQFDPRMVSALMEAYQAGDLNPQLQPSGLDSREFTCPFCSTCCAPLQDTISQQEMVCPTCGRRLILFSEDGYFHVTLDFQRSPNQRVTVPAREEAQEVGADSDPALEDLLAKRKTTKY